MWWVRAVTAFAVACAGARAGVIDMNDAASYYVMPRIHYLDDFEGCLSRPGGVYCLGSFQLTAAPGGEQLLTDLQEYSKNPYVLNHTELNRGWCVTSRCHLPAIGASISKNKMAAWFEECLSNHTRKRYRLEAKIAKLDYCKVSGEPTVRPPDDVDWMFAYLVMFILGFNVFGTFYDLSRNQETKPVKLIQAWSVIASWRRFTTTREDDDPRLSAFMPMHGMKVLSTILVIMAHTTFLIYMSYIHNPRGVELMATGLFATALYNGSHITQTFLMLAGFLYACNLLYAMEQNPKMTVSIKQWPLHVMYRVFRILPVHMFMVGLMGTWWRQFNDGVLWTSMVEAEGQVCRDKWWSHLLFIHNLYKPDDKCLLQSWFIAVDMQLFILTSFITLLMMTWKRRSAMQVMAAFCFIFVAFNGFLVYRYDMKTMLFAGRTKILRTFFRGSTTFNWLYAAPWGSAPAAFVGVFNGFLHHKLETRGFKFNEHKILRIAYRLSVPLLFAWVWGPHLFRDSTDPVFIWVFTTIDRVGFTLICSVAFFGFINKCDYIWWKFLSWSGWRVLSRLSLPALMLHWSINLTLAASRSSLFYFTVPHSLSEWFCTTVLTYIFAVPLHLLLEVPAQMMFKALML